jgi:hypothetical protein
MLGNSCSHSNFQVNYYFKSEDFDASGNTPALIQADCK